jgi:hypothetical protein
MTIKLIGKMYGGEEILNFINFNKICINDIIKHKFGIEDEKYYIVTSISENYVKVCSLITEKNEYGLDLFYNNQVQEIYLQQEPYSMVMYSNIRYPLSYKLLKLININRIINSNIFCFPKINMSIVLMLLLIITSVLISYYILNPIHFIISIIFIHTIILYIINK